MTITTSRRAVLAGAAALPALSLPAIANDQDAELWRHADAIIRLWPEHERLRAIENEVGERMHKRVLELSGLYEGHPYDPDAETKITAALKIADYETDHSKRCREFDTVADRVVDHVQAIEKIPTQSIIGLAAKAIAAGTAIMGEWDKPIADVDWPEQRERLLIEAILTAAGVENPFAVAGKAVQS